MSTRIKDSLHELIGTLTKTEKRYFKLYVTRHSSNDDSNMVLLFDFITRQEAYDEQAVFAHFRGKAFLNQFATVKKRLYDQLLQSLHLFHANASLEAQLGRMLHQATILYEKSLYDQSIRQLRSIEKTAQKHDLFLVLVQSGKLKQRIMETQGYHSDEELIDELNGNLQRCLSQEQLLHQLWRIKSTLFRQLQSSGIAASSKDRENLALMISELPSADILERFQSTEATYLYYHILSAYHYATGSFGQSLDYTELNIGHLQKSPAFTENRPNILVSVLTNACYLSETTGQFGKSAEFIQLLKKMEHRQESLSEDLQIKLFSSISSIELSILIMRGEFEHAAPLIRTILTGLEKYGTRIHPARKAFFQLKLAVIHLGNEDFSSALKHIHLILNNTDLDEKEEIMISAHLLNVVVHFELKHTEYLPNAIKNAQRLLKSLGRFREAEAAFLQILAKTTRSHMLDFPELFSELSQKLRGLPEEEQQTTLSVHFDFLTWVDAKVRQHSLAQAVRDKYHFLASA